MAAVVVVGGDRPTPGARVVNGLGYTRTMPRGEETASNGESVGLGARVERRPEHGQLAGLLPRRQRLVVEQRIQFFWQLGQSGGSGSSGGGDSGGGRTAVDR